MNDITTTLRDLQVATNREPGAAFTDGVLARVGLVDAFTLHASPLGDMYVAWNPSGISAVMRATDDAAFATWFFGRFGRRAVRTTATPPMSAKRYDLRSCSPFERAVLEKAREIGNGEVRSYAWIAREIGNPKAVRAVGTALAKNPVPIAIPCHRVVRSDGTIGDYVFGSGDKRRILESEGVDIEAITRAARAGERFVGSDTTKVFCLPTCRYPKKITSKHRRTFGNEAEAREAGYRPCKHCRPALAG